MTARQFDEVGRPFFPLSPGQTAFVDRDWLGAARSGAIEAPVLDNDGSLRWGRRELAPSPEAPERDAARLIAGFATDIAGELKRLPPDRIRVIGVGVTAYVVRRRLGIREGDTESPAAIVELSGDPESLVSACESVADGGLVVAAGHYVHPVDINLYATVHKRGLRMKGVVQSGRREDAAEDVPAPVAVTTQSAVPEALWYRVSCTE